MKVFARKGGGMNLKRGGNGGGSCRNGGIATFFVTLQFNHIDYVCGESKVPFITFQIFNLLS